MRGYTSISAIELKNWLNDGSIAIENLYAPTEDFVAANSDLDEEEIEFTLSMLAAEEALEVKDADTGAACVLAFEIPDEIRSSTSELCIQLSAPLKWEYLECLFEVSEDGEELTWFATQEVAPTIAELLKK